MECYGQQDVNDVDRSKCTGAATIACLGCPPVLSGVQSIYYCKTCWEATHISPRELTHKTMDAAQHAFLTQEQALDPTEEDHQEDERNVICGVVLDKRKLIVGPKFFELKTHLAPEDPIHVVSFVAPSGAGKSRLMRHMCSDPKPLPARPQSHTPCSSDIHAYMGMNAVGVLGTMTERSPVVYLDSEGVGADKTVLESKIHAKGLIEKWWPKYAVDKNAYVEDSYPRLLYLFSDVWCFPFRGMPKAHLHVIDPLIRYARAAAAATVNKVHRPYLVVVFNCIDEGDVGLDWSVETATRNFLYNDQTKGVEGMKQGVEELLSYFALVRVVYVPRCENMFDRYIKQLSALQEEVETALRLSNAAKTERGMKLSREQWCSMFSKAVADLALDPHAPLDWHTLKTTFAQDLEGASKVMACAWLEIARHYMASKEIAERGAMKQATNYLKSRVFHALVYADWMGAASTPDLNFGEKKAELPAHYSTLLQAVGDAIDAEQRCTARHVFVGHEERVTATCGTCLREHVNGHESTDFYYTREKINAEDRTFWQKIGFVTHEKVKRPCRWEGKFEGTWKGSELKNAAVAKLRTSDKTYQFHLDHYLQSLSSEDVSTLKTAEVCLVCLIRFPTERHSCGHYMCSPCTQQVVRADDTGNCPLCKKAIAWRNRDVPPTAGVRILSMDGGGVRGLVEALVLARLEDLCDFPCADLFDLIVGTSAGGLLALGLTVRHDHGQPWSASEMADRVVSIGKTVFQRQQYFNFWGLWRSKYSLGSLRKELERLLPTGARLNTGSTATKVAVTTCCIESGGGVGHLITSYNRATAQGSGFPLIRNFNAVDAGLATSAAPTYFDPALAMGHVMIDGGVLWNCPAQLAESEKNLLWPSHPTDVIVSLGNAGQAEPGETLKHKAMENVSGLTACIELISSTKEVVTFMETLHKDDGVFERVDPKMKSKYPMDIGNVQVINQLRTDVGSWMTENAEVITTLGKRLVAKMFFAVLTSTPQPGVFELSGTVAQRPSSKAASRALFDKARWRVEVITPAELTYVSTITPNGEDPPSFSVVLNSAHNITFRICLDGHAISGMDMSYTMAD